MSQWIHILLVAIGVVDFSRSQFAEHTRWTRQEAEGAPCTSPNNLEGNCVNIRQCPAMLELLQKGKNRPGVIDFLKKSKCSSERPSDVCCPIARSRTIASNNNITSDIYSNVLSPPQCGTRYFGQETRIVGGVPSEQGAWPWIVLLGYRTNSNPGPMWQCGGALITDRFVLTAAHCVNPPQYGMRMTTVRLGEHEINKNSGINNVIDIAIDGALAHPSYNTRTKLDDIGLVKLRQPVTFTKYIQPICLPKAPELRSQNLENKAPFVAGWGSISAGGPASNKLLQVQVPVVDNDSCNKAYSPKGANILERQLCAGYQRGGKDACQGDSGGPLMMPVGRSFYLIGVVSFGYKCAEPGFPGVYSRVTNYLDWISKNMK